MDSGELKKALSDFGALNALTLVEALETTAIDLTQRVAVLEERLKKAMERETETVERANTERQQQVAAWEKQQKEAVAREAEATERANAAERRVAELQAQLDTMESHPEVRAAKKARLMAQAEQLKAQAEAIAE